MMAVADLRRIDLSLALLLAITAASPLLAACGDSGGDSATASESATSVTTVTTATTAPPPTSSDSTPTSGESASGSGSSTGPGGSDSATGSETGTPGTTNGGLKLDVGVGDTTTGAPAMGCRKVDFLFVIDNSGSMSDEQQNLINSFPSFIQTIQDQLEEAQDYHIMVVDTDAYVFGGCEGLCPLFLNTCPVALNQYTCGVTKPELCEDVIGAGVTYPKGQASTNKDCNFASQARYMDVSEPDLTSTFACAAKVGTGSTVDPERPMEAMVAAVASAGKSADCNLGFLRKDAILVVTFITDEDDSANDGSKGTVDGWKASLIAAKKGDETALVVLGLFGDGDKPDGICPPFDPDNSTGAEPSPRLRQFVDSFGERGVAGSVCADSYKDFFMEAVGIIDSTCDGFVPPPM